MEIRPDELRAQIKKGEPARLYILHGEESYLREFMLAEMKRQLISEGLEAFNYDRINGGKLDLQELVRITDTAPMLCERRLVVVTDFNVYAPGAGTEAAFLRFLEELPETVVLVFHFDTLPHKPDGRSKMTQAVRKLAQIAEFPYLKDNELIPWTVKYFARNGKSIDTFAAERLVFLCGCKMQNLRNEIAKLTAYAPADYVTIDHVNELVTAEPEARVFDFTRAVTAGKQKKAAQLLREMLETDEPHVRILSILTTQILQIYAARLLLEHHKGDGKLSELCGLKSGYQTRVIMETARSCRLVWLRKALEACWLTDLNLKGQGGRDRALELLLGRLFTAEGA